MCHYASSTKETFSSKVETLKPICLSKFIQKKCFLSTDNIITNLEWVKKVK